jgi:hypothetical protein
LLDELITPLAFLPAKDRLYGNEVASFWWYEQRSSSVLVNKLFQYLAVMGSVVVNYDEFVS